MSYELQNDIFYDGKGNSGDRVTTRFTSCRGVYIRRMALRYGVRNNDRRLAFNRRFSHETVAAEKYGFLLERGVYNRRYLLDGRFARGGCSVYDKRRDSYVCGRCFRDCQRTYDDRRFGSSDCRKFIAFRSLLEIVLSLDRRNGRYSVRDGCNFESARPFDAYIKSGDAGANRR